MVDGMSPDTAELLGHIVVVAEEDKRLKSLIESSLPKIVPYRWVHPDEEC